jgi:hypothetical protein
MSEPITLYDVATGGKVVMYAPAEARRMIDSNKYSMIAPTAEPVAAAQPKRKAKAK